MSCVNSERGDLQPGKLPYTCRIGQCRFYSRSNDREAIINCPQSFRASSNGRTRHYYENQEKWRWQHRNAERCEGEFNAQMRVPGQHEITAIEKRKLSSKREDILDNMNRARQKYGAASVVVDEQSWYLQAWKSRPIKRDYDHILKTYLQITYKLTTFTGVAYGTRYDKGTQDVVTNIMK